MAKAAGVFALLCLSMPARARAGAHQPMACAEDMSNFVEVIAETAEDIVFSVVDCTPPSLDEMDCASDIIDAVRMMAKVSATISSSTYTCGGINNACADTVSSTVAEFMDLAGNLIAAAADCALAPFNCVVDCFESLNNVMTIAVEIFSAVEDCNAKTVSIPGDNDAQPAEVELAPDVEDIPELQAEPVERRLVGAGPVQAPGKTPHGRSKGWKQHLAIAGEQMARMRQHSAPLGGEAEARAGRPRVAFPPLEALRRAAEASAAAGRRLRRALNGTAGLPTAGTGIYVL